MMFNLSRLFKLDFGRDTSANRLLIILTLFAMFYIGVSARVIYLSVYDEYGKQTSMLKQKVWRKEIIDRNGKVLATNVPSASAFINPHKVADKAGTIDAIIKIIPSLNKQKLLTEFNSGKNFVWIKRDLTPSAQKKLHDLGIPGLEFEEEYKRVHMYGNVAVHILGYTGRENNGLAGIEKFFDQQLSGKLTPQNNLNDKNQLQLSIDIDLQNIVSEELSAAVKEFKAIGGLAIIVDPNNGEILAMSSKPDFDPHNINNAKEEELFSKPSLGVYEIGSVFKAILLAIAFDTKTIQMHDAYNLANFQVSNLTVKDFHPHFGWHTVPEIFMHSSNIGVAQMALEMGGDVIKDYLQKLGFFSPLSIEIPEKGYPLFPSKKKKWEDITLVTMSYGYAISGTPLHFVQGMVPIVNGGIFYPLTLIKDKNNYANDKKRTQVLNAETSEQINKLMRLTVTNGTAKKIDVEGYLVGGKTGTAQKIKNGKYANDHRMSSLVSIIPSHEPKYLIYVLLDDPQGNKSTFGFATAGYTVTPFINKIITRIVALHNLKPVEVNEGLTQRMQVDYKISDNKDL